MLTVPAVVPIIAGHVIQVIISKVDIATNVMIAA